jgi:hypothetical protein
LLIFASPHRVIHDAESLLYVLLFLCSHLAGPGEVRDPPLYGSGPSGSEHPSGIKQWLAATNLNTLGHTKFSHMGAHIDVEILPHLSPYFSPLRSHICNLWTALFPNQLSTGGPHASHSKATILDLIKAFKKVLSDPDLIARAKDAAPGNLRKRSRPGELIIAANGWDAIHPSKKQVVVKTTTEKRRTSFMRKSRK